MAHQEMLRLRTSRRGMMEITPQVMEIVKRSQIKTGLAHIFVRHTSCSLLVTENADPDVLRDLETLACRWAPDGDPAYAHDLEGDDDMAAHGRSVLTDTSVTIPFGDGRLLLGSWQGIFLWEHRTQGHSREVIVTLMG